MASATRTTERGVLASADVTPETPPPLALKLKALLGGVPGVRGLLLVGDSGGMPGRGALRVAIRAAF
jgi:hypothetical protein